MKIEKIHLNKIKVTFTSEDLIEHNITPEAVRDNAPWVQKVLMTVVKRAEEEIGFEAHDARLMVEAMPGENDSMVMYITRLDSEEDIKDVLHSAKKRVKLKVRPANTAHSTNVCISFDTFEDAVSLAHTATDYEDGELYFYRDRYHLIVSSCAPWFMAEFGSFFADDTMCNIVSEHGKKICDNAMSVLRKHF